MKIKNNTTQNSAAGLIVELERKPDGAYSLPSSILKALLYLLEKRKEDEKEQQEKRHSIVSSAQYMATQEDRNYQREDALRKMDNFQVETTTAYKLQEALISVAQEVTGNHLDTLIQSGEVVLGDPVHAQDIGKYVRSVKFLQFQRELFAEISRQEAE